MRRALLVLAVAGSVIAVALIGTRHSHPGDYRVAAEFDTA